MVEPSAHVVRPAEFVWDEQVGENESGLAGSAREDINQFEDDL
jgi:hypothetical protein